MKFFTRSEARSAANRAQARTRHVLLDSVLNEAIKNQERKNSFDRLCCIKPLKIELS